MDKIKLSILIPLFNYKEGAEKIINCLKNIDDKEGRFIEVIISDDSLSPLINENTLNLLMEKFINFKYFFNNNKYGAVHNWNRLIKLSRGDYFWLIHHDEYWDQETLIIRKIIERINNQENFIFILPIKKIFHFKKRIFNFNVLQTHSAKKNLIQKFILNPIYLIDINIIGPPSAFIISKKFKYLYNPKLKVLVDVFYYKKLFELVDYSYIDILKNNCFYIYSLQNNKYSITNSLKEKFNKLTVKEKEIMGKIKKPYYYIFKKLYYFIKYKFYCLISTRIYFD